MSSHKVQQQAGNGTPLGPSVVLLCGYSHEESLKVASLLNEIGALGHRVARCTEPMLKKPLGNALAKQDEALPVPPEKLPRVIVLSGLTDRQVRAFLVAYRTSLLPRPIFATVTANNLHFRVRDLLVELLQEHHAMQRNA